MIVPTSHVSHFSPLSFPHLWCWWVLLEQQQCSFVRCARCFEAALRTCEWSKRHGASHDAPNCGSNDGASAKAALGSGWGTKEISDQQKEGCKICKSMQEVFANPATGQDSPAARLGHAVPWRCAKWVAGCIYVPKQRCQKGRIVKYQW